MSIIFKIPQDLLRTIVEEWIQVVEWTCIDSAVCNCNRNTYLRLIGEQISYCSGRHTNRGIALTAEFYLWCYLRTIQLDSLEIDCIQEELYGLNFTKVETITLTGIDERDYTRLINCCHNLRSLKCVSMSIGEADINPKILNNLEHLILVESSFSRECFSSISTHCCHLQEFYSYSLAISSSDCIFQMIKNNPSLHTFSCSKYISTDMLGLLYNNCPLLEVIFVYCNTINYEYILRIFQRGKIRDIVVDDANSFRFQFCERTEAGKPQKILRLFGLSISDSLLNLMEVMAVGLTELYLPTVENLTDQNFLTLVSNSLQTLRRLDFDDCYLISYQVMRQVFSSALNLEHICMWNSSHYSDEDFKLILCPAMPSWTVVEISYNITITLSTILLMLDSAIGLRKLELNTCTLLLDNDVQDIKMKCGESITLLHNHKVI